MQEEEEEEEKEKKTVDNEKSFQVARMEGTFRSVWPFPLIL